MILFSKLILLVLIISAISVSLIKDTFGAIIVFAVYSVLMAILWQLLESPDLAITEAAIGGGITTVLFVLTYIKIKKKRGES